MRRIFKALAVFLLAAAMLLPSAAALTVEQALELLEASYYFDIPDEVREAEDVYSLMEQLGDPYSYYMDPEAYRSFLESVEDTVDLVGIGVSIQYTSEGILVIEPIVGGSAYEAGIQSGDLIVAVDGVSCVPGNDSHRKLILGEEGSEVTVTVLRDGVKLDYVLTRCHIVIPNTEFSVVNDHIGYIDCDSFGSNTGELFLDGVLTHHETVDCWLVDLRANSGGYSQSAVDALGVLAGAGAHLYLETGDGRLYYYAYRYHASSDRPVVVLVDEYTASASEAFAAGVRDLDAGISVGGRTYGKGVAQILRDATTDPEYFAQGDALKLTAYRFYSNGGVTNDRVGVIPTLLVPDEMAEAVAVALCGTQREGLDDHLFLQMNGQVYAVDVQATQENVLAALLEAVPPGALLWYFDGMDSVDCTAWEAAQHFGIRYSSRWFEDVAESPFADAVNALATYEMLAGDSDGNFRPKDTVTRGDACAMIAGALSLGTSDREVFTDVAETDPNAPYINALSEAGLVCGMGDGTFRPDQEMTRQECVSLLARVLRYLNVDWDYRASVQTDERHDEMRAVGFHGWACGSAVLMDEAGALCFSGETSEPNGAVLREEAAAGLYAVLTAAGVF